MLCPSGMFYDDAAMQDIITLVQNANVPAIYPEKLFKTKHRPNYPCWFHGHKIPETYKKAASLANDALQNRMTSGGEADTDDDTGGIGLLGYVRDWCRRMINK